MFKSRRMLNYLAIGFALALLASACGGTADSAEPDPETTVPAVVDDSSTTTTIAADEEVAPEDSADDGDDHDEEEGGQDDGGDTAAEVDRVIDVTMDDFTFSPDAFSFTAGETVRFVVTNVGLVEHEFRLSNEHRIEEHLADAHSDDDHDDDDGGHEEDSDIFLHLEAGESSEMTVTFPMDQSIFTEVACLIPGHYEAGMAAALDYDL